MAEGSRTLPELVFATAGPIGVDVEAISRALAEALNDVGYEVIHIKLTEEMARFGDGPMNPATPGKFSEYWAKMDYANAVRGKYKTSDALGRIAIDAVREARAQGNQRRLEKRRSGGTEATDDRLDSAQLRDRPLEGVAYVIRQLKHPDEVAILRQVYGKRFILVSAYASESSRKKKLCDDIKRTESTQSPQSEIERKAIQLIERDASETGERLGQQLRDTFHLADMFVDGVAHDRMKQGLERFVDAFFGRTTITPSKDEYGMYAAKSASLRSGDLSRQVGAALFSCEGELITQGCNEVPKAKGGTYWDGEVPDYRDFRKGYDPNDRQKREVLRDIIERLRKAGHLSPELVSTGNDTAIVDRLTKKPKGPEEGGPLSESWLMDVTEYGRIVHAEMCALCDAARLGRTVRGSTLFCTTFPCHNCTKHLIAAGVYRVVYMEPYPKSRAQELHEDEIEWESENDNTKVSFVPFLGVSPFRYRDIFQKGKRKSNEGVAMSWLQGEPFPMVEPDEVAYLINEKWALAPFVGELAPASD